MNKTKFINDATYIINYYNIEFIKIYQSKFSTDSFYIVVKEGTFYLFYDFHMKEPVFWLARFLTLKNKKRVLLNE